MSEEDEIGFVADLKSRAFLGCGEISEICHAYLLRYHGDTDPMTCVEVVGILSICVSPERREETFIRWLENEASENFENMALNISFSISETHGFSDEFVINLFRMSSNIAFAQRVILGGYAKRLQYGSGSVQTLRLLIGTVGSKCKEVDFIKTQMLIKKISTALDL